MKIKTLSVQMKDNSTVGDADTPGVQNYVVSKITQQIPTTPNEKVDANPARTDIYTGSSRVDAMAAKEAAEREMFAV